MSSPQRKYAQPSVPQAGGDAAAGSGNKPYTSPRLICLGWLDEGDARRIAFDDTGR